VPIDEWLRGFLREHLAPERLRAHALVAPAFVEQMLREHEERRRNRSRELFAVLVLQLWYDRWQSKPPAIGS
jgi:hypothetical protein